MSELGRRAATLLRRMADRLDPGGAPHVTNPLTIPLGEAVAGDLYRITAAGTYSESEEVASPGDAELFRLAVRDDLKRGERLWKVVLITLLAVQGLAAAVIVFAQVAKGLGLDR